MNIYKRHRCAMRLKRRHQGYGDTCFIDEVFVKIQGKQQYLWRAVDQVGEVVDVYLQAPHCSFSHRYTLDYPVCDNGRVDFAWHHSHSNDHYLAARRTEET